MSPSEIKARLMESLEALGERHRVLIVPPDFTRYHSFAGQLTEWVWEYFGDRVQAVLPALGTHTGMTQVQIKKMFGRVPAHLFVEHNWRNDVITLGEVPALFVHEVTEGKLNFPWPVQVNKLLVEGNFDLILSVGQVVPHEVVGMANHNKNIFVGTGGPEGINTSHFIGAVYGMERMMGRADTPVRRIFDYASEHIAQHLPIYYLLTVVGREGVSGVFTGAGKACFHQAAALALKENFTLLDEPLQKVLVYLDPEEYKSTWLGNKSIYRTRMAMADDGELIILAPGLTEFGEDQEIDRLIRTYGYRGTPNTLDQVQRQADLAANLSAAAHLIHGSSEGRFTIRYCPGSQPHNLNRQAIEAVGFEWGDWNQYISQYQPDRLKPGYNRIGDEQVYFISNPAMGLWSTKERFKE